MVSSCSFSIVQAYLFIEVKVCHHLCQLYSIVLHTFSNSAVMPLNPVAFLVFTRLSSSISAFTHSVSQGPFFFQHSIFFHLFFSPCSFFHTLSTPPSYPPDSPFYFYFYCDCETFQQYFCFLLCFFNTNNYCKGTVSVDQPFPYLLFLLL